MTYRSKPGAGKPRAVAPGTTLGHHRLAATQPGFLVWTLEEIAILEELWEQGCDIGYIAVDLDRPRMDVGEKAQFVGLYRRPRRVLWHMHQHPEFKAYRTTGGRRAPGGWDVSAEAAAEADGDELHAAGGDPAGTAPASKTPAEVRGDNIRPVTADMEANAKALADGARDYHNRQKARTEGGPDGG